MENESDKNFIVFEFFSGIGGMCESLNQIKNIKIKKIFPFDININSNITYEYNYKIKSFNISIESFSLKNYEDLVDQNRDDKTLIFWTMSPPCQPYTRQGKVEGLNDNRTNAFTHLMNNIFKKTKYLPDLFFLENVKNFEISEANEMLINILSSKGYSYLQFLLSPIQFNIPNSRLRFYLIASKLKKFDLEDYTNNKNKIIQEPNILFENKIFPKINIKNYLNINQEEDFIKNKNYYLSKEVLEKKGCLSMDIVTLEKYNTNCFTKSYTKLFKGTGSILLINEKLYKENMNPSELFGYIRYFTPEEILKLMCFSDKFLFPNNFSDKVKYKLLGNSINVKVVNILMEYLVS